MKKGFIFFVALLLFVFFAAVTASAKEERESQKITVRSHDINNGVVILVAREGTNLLSCTATRRCRDAHR